MDNNPAMSKSNSPIHRDLWYWVTISTALMSTIVVLTVPDSAYPWVYFRYILAGIFVVFLPGYTVLKIFYYNTLPVVTKNKTSDILERFLLSFGISFSLIPIIGLILTNTQFGITLISLTLSLFLLTILSATIAMINWKAKGCHSNKNTI